MAKKFLGALSEAFEGAILRAARKRDKPLVCVGRYCRK
jgi:hypothetical protein